MIALSESNSLIVGMIEARIQEHMKMAYNGLLAVGRDLIEAKESGAIPHGEWEGWIQRNTGMTIRQAQRYMDVARNVPDGSAVARLPFSKMQLLITAPEEKREALAQRTEQEGLTVRQLKEEIERLKGQNERSEKNLEALRTDMEKRVIEQAKSLSSAQQKNRDSQSNLMQQRLRESEQAVTDARKEIDRLKEQLKGAEDYAAKQNEEKQKLTQEMLKMKKDGQSRAPEMDWRYLSDNVNTFMAAVRPLTGMEKECAALPDRQRSPMIGQVKTVKFWADRMLSMLEGSYALTDADAEVR